MQAPDETPTRYTHPGPGASRDARRRRFRPLVAGLEGRQLMSGSTVNTVVSFSGAGGSVVGGLARDVQGNLYGATSAGDEAASTVGGTVFEVPAGSKAAITLGKFAGNQAFEVDGVVLDAQGDLFGTTRMGGAYNEGTVFEIARGSGTVTTLASFTGANGMDPNGLTIDAQGNLFGTTAVGGANGSASAFEVPAGTNIIVPIAIFPGSGSAPRDLVVDAQDNLYGTNSAGGPGGAGSVFEIARGSNTVTTLAAFPDLDGAGIGRVSLDAQGDLFGTTEDGGKDGFGTVFEIARGTNVATTLASFDGVIGATPVPEAGVVLDAQGNLYGVSAGGGVYSNGTVFKVARGSNTITNLSSFDNPDGSLVTGLLLDGQGNLEGTTAGASSQAGTLFKFELPKPAPIPPSRPVAPHPAAVGTAKPSEPAKRAPKPHAIPGVAKVGSVAKGHQTLLKAARKK